MAQKNSWEKTGQVAAARLWCDACETTTTWTIKISKTDTKREIYTCRCGVTKEYITR